MKNVKRALIKVFDSYLRFAISIDLILFAAIIFLQNRYNLFQVPNLQQNSWVQDTFSNLIATSVSLSGFILAALTIIVTFKSSIKAKLSDSEFEKLNGLELILSSKHYITIIELFKQVLYELVFVFILLSYFWLFQQEFTNTAIYYSLVYATLAISLALTRTIIVLFKILILDK